MNKKKKAMSKEKVVCPSCQQPFTGKKGSEICECTFEEQMEALRQEDMMDYKETVKRKPDKQAAKIYELRQNQNNNRYKTN